MAPLCYRVAPFVIKKTQKADRKILEFHKADNYKYKNSVLLSSTEGSDHKPFCQKLSEDK